MLKQELQRCRAGLVPQAVAALKALQHGTSPLPGMLVFLSKEGTPLRRSNLHRRVWAKLLKSAKVRPAGFHAARRGHISELLANGADLKSVSVRVGHADTRITTDVYQQVRSDAGRRLAALTGSLLAAKEESA